MAIDADFIASIPPPLCPYCKQPMFADHSKAWTGQRWQYLAIQFQCRGDNAPPHSVMIRARTVEEWKAHLDFVAN